MNMNILARDESAFQTKIPDFPFPHAAPGIAPTPCSIQVRPDGMHFRLGGDQDALSLIVRDRYGWPED
ncbi:MAG: hypothetical protein O7A66_09630, partial [Alphaproteobacteria bacterium]|nr:hypothetical protein [Alphaproteobacteria bacterium]